MTHTKLCNRTAEKALLFWRVIRHGGDNVDDYYSDGEDRHEMIRLALQWNNQLCALGFTLTASAIIAAAFDLIIPAVVTGVIGAYLDWRTYRVKARFG